MSEEHLEAIEQFNKLKEDVGEEHGVSEPEEEERAEEAEQAPQEDLLESLPEEDKEYAKGFDPEGPKTLEQYINDGKFMKRIQNQSKEISELKQLVEGMKGHMDKQQELGYKKAVEDLKQRRLHAIKHGDVEEVDAIEEEIKAHTSELEKKDTSKESLDAESQAAAEGFAEKHASWINANDAEAKAMKLFVKQYDIELAQKGLPPHEHIAAVEKELAAAFPNRLGVKSAEKEEKPAVHEVESGHSVANKKSKRVSFNDLNADQKKCCRQFVKRGVMTEDQYIKQLKELGEI